MHSLRDPVCYPPSSIPRYPWKIVARFIQGKRNSRVGCGWEQVVREEAIRNQNLEILFHYGVAAAHPPVRLGPFGIRALSVPLAGQLLGSVGCHRVRGFWVHFLLGHRHSVRGLLRLSVSNTAFPFSSFCGLIGYLLLTEPPTNLWIHTTTPPAWNPADTNQSAPFDYNCRQRPRLTSQHHRARFRDPERNLVTPADCSSLRPGKGFRG